MGEKNDTKHEFECSVDVGPVVCVGGWGDCDDVPGESHRSSGLRDGLCMVWISRKVGIWSDETVSLQSVCLCSTFSCRVS